MHLNKLRMAVLLALALSGLFAASANASNWEIGGTKFTAGQTEAVTGAAVGSTTLESKVLGSALQITYSDHETVETELTASGTHRLNVTKYASASVVQPAGCKTTPLELKSVTGAAGMGNTEATKGGVYVKFAPNSGEVLGTLKLTECAAAGSYQVKGNFFVKAVNGTGVNAVKQEYQSSGAINSSQGGALTLGKESATLTGTVGISLSGANAGKAWGLVE
jgi:hypothetical protein